MSPLASNAALIDRLCPVCGAQPAKPHLAKGELRLVQCHACTMVYSTPVPQTFASGEYYDLAGGEYYLSPAKLESDYSPVRFERELRLFRRHCKTGSVLDVGCSSGAFLFQLSQRFPGSYQLLGTDASGPALDFAESKGVPVLRGDFLEQPFDNQRFDGVTFWAVLEHLLEPKRFLEKAATLLKPGALCFVLVPNLQSLATRLLGARYRYIYPQHLNYFTRRTLTRLVQDRFNVIEQHSTHFNPIVIWQDFRQRGAEVSNQDRAALLKRTTAYKKSPLLKPAKLLYTAAERFLGWGTLADNLVVVLRKR
jgi:2-polyprenyl-3-methyl-5-hydroxy-6-metoxy-1,4-benzoquinol methylase